MIFKEYSAANHTYAAYKASVHILPDDVIIRNLQEYKDLKDRSNWVKALIDEASERGLIWKDDATCTERTSGD